MPSPPSRHQIRPCRRGQHLPVDARPAPRARAGGVQATVARLAGGYFPITDDPPKPTAEEDEDEGAGDDEDDAEDIGKLLEPLSREQLVALLRTAAEASPATMAAVRRAAEDDPASRKLFVHDLGWGAGADDLRSAFARFGELEDCRVICDKQSGRSKGSVESACRALEEPMRNFDGNMLDVQKAIDGRTKGSSGTNANS